MRQLVLLVSTATFVLSSTVGLAIAENRSEFGERVAGTYLSNGGDDAVILQLGRDGNMTVILSEQFLSLGVIGESFSDTLGTWKRAGNRKIVASSVNIAFDGEIFVGVAATKYVISFDPPFGTAFLGCTGALFSPGVDPFAPNAEPIPGSEFTCNEYTLARLR